MKHETSRLILSPARQKGPPSEEAELCRLIQERLRAYPPAAPAVVVPVFNAYEDAVECVNSLLATCAPDVPLLVIDDASTDERVSALAADPRLIFVRKPANTGFVSSANLAFAGCAPRDVVVVNSDVVLPPEWLERLRAAAYSHSTVATATPLTNHGSVVSVPYRNQPTGELAGGRSVAEVDARIRRSALRLYPLLPTAVGHCIYFKRAALDTVGDLDDAFAPGYGEEVDFCQRATLAGFCHVLADDLFVYHKGCRSFDGSEDDRSSRLKNAHERMLRQRYPWYAPWVVRTATDTQGPFGLAIERAQAALVGYRVAIDATCIAGLVTGTQLVTLELIRALASAPERPARLAMIVRDEVDRAALFGVDGLVDEVVPLSQLEDIAEPVFDLVHRPFQIRALRDLAFLQRIGRRCVVSQLDFISYSNPGYEPSPEEWERYRYLTRLVCRLADGIVFISADVAAYARQLGIDPEAARSAVIPPGVDHVLARRQPGASAAGSELPGPPFILVLGTSFWHKNRVYALRMFRALIDQHGWAGKLVIAGPQVACGGSEADEAALMEGSPELRSRVCFLSAVDEAQKQALYENASLLLYPSICEGFGLTPFEAAQLGAPSLSTRAGSLNEVLGDEVTYLETLSPEDGAQVVARLLADPELAARQRDAIRARSREFSWAACAARSWDFYGRLLAMPARPRERRVPGAWTPELRRDLSTGDEALPEWRRRLAMGCYILFAEGPGPLWYEVRQYLRWLVNTAWKPR